MALPRNIRLLLGYSFFSMFLVIIPVIVPYYLSLGLTMSQVFQVQAVFAFSVAVLEVPTGYLSDIWSRRKTLLVGALLLGIGFSVLPFCRNFSHLVVFEIVVACAHSFISGTDVALLYDSLGDASNDRRTTKNALANLQFSAVTAESIASLLSGVLVMISFSKVLLAQAIGAWMPFVFALFIVEPVVTRMDTSTHLENFKRILKHIFVSDRTLRLIFLNLTVFGLSTFFAVWILQKYWQDAGIPLAWFGAIWALFNFSVGIIGKLTHRLEEKLGPVPLLLVIAITPALAYFTMGWRFSLLGVASGILFYISRGFCQVLLNDAFNWRVPTEFRATANSLSSLVFRLSFAISAPLVGYCVDRYGLLAALRGLGGAVVVAIIFLMLPLIRDISKKAPEGIPYPPNSK
ncbi:MAG: MFS transporter [Bdellovibrionota bacterium]